MAPLTINTNTGEWSLADQEVFPISGAGTSSHFCYGPFGVRSNPSEGNLSELPGCQILVSQDSEPSEYMRDTGHSPPENISGDFWTALGRYIRAIRHASVDDPFGPTMNYQILGVQEIKPDAGKYLQGTGPVPLGSSFNWGVPAQHIEKWHHLYEQSINLDRTVLRQLMVGPKVPGVIATFRNSSDWDILLPGLSEELKPALDAELHEALEDLANTISEAEREGYPKPSEAARANAERFLKKMYKILPRRFEVYPTPDAEIAIDAPNGYDSSVLLLCDTEGHALCLVNMGGEQRSKDYATSDSLPDEFLREALGALAHANQ